MSQLSEPLAIRPAEDADKERARAAAVLAKQAPRRSPKTTRKEASDGA